MSAFLLLFVAMVVSINVHNLSLSVAPSARAPAPLSAVPAVAGVEKDIRRSRGGRSGAAGFCGRNLLFSFAATLTGDSEHKINTQDRTGIAPKRPNAHNESPPNSGKHF